MLTPKFDYRWGKYSCMKKVFFNNFSEKVNIIIKEIDESHFNNNDKVKLKNKLSEIFKRAAERD